MPFHFTLPPMHGVPQQWHLYFNWPPPHVCSAAFNEQCNKNKLVLTQQMKSISFILNYIYMVPMLRRRRHLHDGCSIISFMFSSRMYISPRHIPCRRSPIRTLIIVVNSILAEISAEAVIMTTEIQSAYVRFEVNGGWPEQCQALGKWCLI